ncbi:hypothetical protein N8Z79_02115 [Crocinitomicaceae bacterium]|nr:hypothetical protein [Crocinitomicaceae bacterium]
MKLIVFAILIFLSSLSTNGQSGIRINVETQVVCEGQVQLVVSGDFVNNGTFTPSNGTIYLKGSSKQNIGGSGNNTFYGIELDNASGADLSSDIAVTNELNLNNGILDLVNSNLTMGTGAAVLGAPSESNMVVTSGTGELRKRFSGTPISDDSDAFTFPVGSNGSTAEYSPVVMNFQSADFGPQAYVSVQVADTKNPFFSPDVSTYIDRNWVVEPNDMSNYNYEVQLYYTDADLVLGPLIEGDISPVKYSNGTWYEPQGLIPDFPDALEQGSAFIFASSNYMVWGDLTSFSIFGGVGGTGEPLPVELLSFSGDCQDGASVLKWSTASEHNSSYFDVEKSDNGFDWEIIHSEDAAGISTSLIEYEFVDVNKFYNTTYYRLNQFDIDGVNHYYGPIEVSCEERSRLITFPNPSDASFNLLINDQRFIGKVDMKILDAHGKLVGFKELNVLDGMNVFPWYETSLEEGMYFILLDTPTNNVTLRHVISE